MYMCPVASEDIVCCNLHVTSMTVLARQHGSSVMPLKSVGPHTVTLVGIHPLLLALRDHLGMKFDKYNAAAGFCSTGQICNAKVATSTIYGEKRSPVAGVCITPKSAGSACTAGTGTNLYSAVTTHHVLARSACKRAPACFHLRLPIAFSTPHTG